MREARRLPVTAEQFIPRNGKILLRRDPAITREGHVDLAVPITQHSCTVISSDSPHYSVGDYVYIASYGGTDLRFDLPNGDRDPGEYVLVSDSDVYGVLRSGEAADANG